MAVNSKQKIYIKVLGIIPSGLRPPAFPARQTAERLLCDAVL